MRLVWLPRARTARTDAIAHIAKDSPRAALGQLDEIEKQTDMLIDQPEMGRPGRVKETRELVIGRTPFIVVYRIRLAAERSEVLYFLHGAQQWP